MMGVDLSADLGEATGAYEQRVEREVFRYVTSANIACGGHVGDAGTMTQAIELALRNDVLPGAHPSYPDRANFGRESMSIAPDALRASLVEQLYGFDRVARAAGTQMHHVKPHGALYNDAHHSQSIASTIVEAVMEIGTAAAIVAAPGSLLEKTSTENGMKVVLEAFADRRYRSDGSLLPRSAPGALLLDPAEAVAQAVKLVTTRCVSASPDGADISLLFDTLCLHADMPGAGPRVEAVRAALERVGCTISYNARFSSAPPDLSRGSSSDAN